MLFIIGLPVVQIILFCISIGRDPKNLELAIVNYELNNSMEPCIPAIDCNWTHLSCRYLHHLEERSIKFLPYDYEKDAKEAVKRGNVWGAIIFPWNYTESLETRITYGKNTDEWSTEYSNMNIYMDMSSEFIYQNLIKFYESFFFEFFYQFF